MTGIVNRIMLIFEREISLTNDQKEIIRFILNVFLNEFSKGIILFTLFLLLKQSHAFIYIMILTLLLRVFSGGDHRNSYLSCLLYSFVYFTLMIVSYQIVPTRLLLYASVVFSILLVIISPVVTKKKAQGFNLPSRYTKLYMSILVTLIMALFLLRLDPIYKLGPMAIIYQTIELMLLKGKNK